MPSSYHLGQKGLDSNPVFSYAVRVSRCMICAKEGAQLFISAIRSFSVSPFLPRPPSYSSPLMFSPSLFSPTCFSSSSPPTSLPFVDILSESQESFVLLGELQTMVLILSQYNHLLNIFYIANLKYIHFCVCHCVYIDVVIDMLYSIFSHLF